MTFKTIPKWTAPSDWGANNIYDITVGATDAAGNTAVKNVAITVDLWIDLGVTYGTLTNPTQVEGNWYYCWDMNGDFSWFDPNNLGIAYDIRSPQSLYGLFNQNVNGMTETLATAVGVVGRMDDTFRYATLNGIKVAMLTYGKPMSGPNAAATGYFAQGTTVVNNATTDNEA